MKHPHRYIEVKIEKVEPKTQTTPTHYKEKKAGKSKPGLKTNNPYLIDWHTKLNSPNLEEQKFWLGTPGPTITKAD